MKRATDKQIRALKIVSENKGISAEGFARKMWVGDEVVNKRKYGKPWLIGGAYLGKLRKMDWVVESLNTRIKRSEGYKLTKSGRLMLILDTQ